MPAVSARQLDQPRQNARDLHHRQVLENFPILGHLQADDQVQRFVEQLRERMGRDRWPAA